MGQMKDLVPLSIYIIHFSNVCCSGFKMNENIKVKGSVLNHESSVIKTRLFTYLHIYTIYFGIYYIFIKTSELINTTLGITCNRYYLLVKINKFENRKKISSCFVQK